jgi:hypothetical protein
MARKKFPELRQTVQRYVDTMRVRVQSPGIEHYRVHRRSVGARIAVALLVLVGVVALAVVWLRG